MAEPATDQENDGVGVGVGAQSRGTMGARLASVFPLPLVTHRHRSPAGGREGRVAVLATARMFDWNPSYLHLQATEMTFVQPLSAVSFLASLPPVPVPAPTPSLPALGALLHQKVST